MRRFFVIAGGVLVILIGGLIFVLTSRTGMQWSIRLAEYVSGGTVTVRQSSGTLTAHPRLLDLKMNLTGADIAIGLLEIDWRPARIFRGSLHVADVTIEGVRVDLKENGKAEPAPRGRIELPELVVPFPFVISELLVSDMAIRGSDATVLLQVNEIAAAFSGSLSDLLIDKLALDTPVYGADLSGSQRIAGDWSTSITGTWWAVPPACERLEGSLRVSGPLENPDFAISVQRPETITISGSLSDLFETPSWQVRGTGKGMALEGICGEWPTLELDLEVESSGNLAHYNGQVRAGSRFEDGFELRLSGELAGNQDGLTNVNAELSSGDNRAQLMGSVGWKDVMSWKAEADLLPMDLKLFGLPEGLAVGGRISSEGRLAHGELRYSAALSDLQATSATPPLEIGGTIQLEGDANGLAVTSSLLSIAESELEITGSIGWQEALAWKAEAVLTPLELSGLGLPQGLSIGGRIRSDGGLVAGELKHHGSLDDLQVSSSNPPIELGGTLEFEGDAAGLVVTSSLLRAEQSEFEFTGSFGWLDGLSWDTRLRLARFNPALLAPMAEGSVDALIQSRGNLAGEAPTIETTISSLSGTFRGYELTGAGQIGYRDNRFTAEDLYIKIGENILRIDGSVGDQLGITFSLAGEELRQFAPELAGRVDISGTVGGNLNEPTIHVVGTGKALSFPGYRAGKARVQATFAPSKPHDFKINTELSDLNIRDREINEAHLRLEGNPEDHSLSLQVRSDTGGISLTGSGGLSDWSRWQGAIKEIRVEHVYGTWYQDGDVMVDVGPAGGALQDLCIYSATTSFCGSGGWQNSGDWFLDVGEFQLLLGELYRWRVLDIPVNGEMTGRLQLAGTKSSITSASSEVQIPEWSMNLELGALAQDFRWFDTTLSVEHQDETLSLETSSRFVDGSTVGGRLNIHGFSDLLGPFDTLALDGSIQADLLDLSPLKLITHDYLIPAGHIEADMRLGGTVGAPLISGEVNLFDGELRFPQLGIVFTEVKGGLSGQGESLDVWLDGVSGGGKAHVEGRLDFSNSSWSSSFTGTGTAVELMNQSDLRMFGTPDIALEIGPEGGHLSGSVHVPKALLEPEQMVSSAAESSDVVFVDVEKVGTGWPFTFDLEISLGEDVRVQGYGLDGRLVGNLRARQDKTGLKTGRGEINVADGSFAIFGSSLNITRGRITFGGGTLDNPGLDISARKRLRADRANSDEIVVGANITGTVYDYRVELFSIPAMEDRDILAYILLDTSFAASESGSKGVVDRALASMGVSGGNALFSGMSDILPVDEMHFEGGFSGDKASLVVGKSLTDRLSVSYDFNLFKNAGFFRVRYEFGKGFSVQSRNSFESNGIELLYSFER